MGDVIGDLSFASPADPDVGRGKTQIVTARVPLHHVQLLHHGWLADQGRATYTMQFASYEEVPKALADEIVAGRTQGISKPQGSQYTTSRYEPAIATRSSSGRSRIFSNWHFFFLQDH